MRIFIESNKNLQIVLKLSVLPDLWCVVAQAKKKKVYMRKRNYTVEMNLEAHNAKRLKVSTSLMGVKEQIHS